MNWKGMKNNNKRFLNRKKSKIFFYRRGERVFYRWIDFTRIKVGNNQIRFILRAIMLKMDNLEKFEMFFSILVELFHNDFNQCGLFLKLLKIIHIWNYREFNEFVFHINPYKLIEPHNFNCLNILVSKIRITKLTRFFSILRYYYDILGLLKGSIKAYFYPLIFWRRFVFLNELSFTRYVKFLNYCGKFVVKFSIIQQIKSLFENLSFRSVLLRVILSNKKKLYLKFLYFLEKIKSFPIGFWETFCNKFEYFSSFLLQLLKSNEKHLLSIEEKKAFEKKKEFISNQGGLFFGGFNLRFGKKLFNKISKNFVKSNHYLKYPKLSKAPVIYDDEWLYDDLLFKKAIDKISNVIFVGCGNFIFTLIFFWFLFFFKNFFLILNKFIISLWFYFFYYLFFFFFENTKKLVVLNKFFYSSRNVFWFFKERQTHLSFFSILFEHFVFYKSDFIYFSELAKFNFSACNIYCEIMSDVLAGAVLDQLYMNFIGKLNLYDLRKAKILVTSLICGSHLMDMENYFGLFGEQYNICYEATEDYASFMRGLYWLNAKGVRR